MGAQFTVPLITVIPGQLIASALWNNEWQNINTNFIPAGMDSYSDTDAQMQIQTNPFPGSVTSHATSLGGEIERIRYQISAILGVTTPDFWYAKTPTDLTTLSNVITPIGAVIDYPSATAPNANYLLANGQAIGRVAYSALFALIGTTFGAGDASTTFNIPNYTDRMSITAGNLYALAATGGVTTPTLTDPGHIHTQNSHSHNDAGHTHSTPNHTHTLATDTPTSLNSLAAIVSNGSHIGVGSGSGGSLQEVTPNTTSGGASTTGSGNASIQTTTTTEQAQVTNITLGTSLPPYLGMYKMIRVL